MGFDGLLSCMGGEYSRYPAGRDLGQYQLVDDISYSRGNHDLKFGVHFRRINFSTYYPLNSYRMGLYGQDEEPIPWTGVL